MILYHIISCHSLLSGLFRENLIEDTSWGAFAGMLVAQFI